MPIKKIPLWEVVKERLLVKQLSRTISIKIQLPLFWDQLSAVPLPVAVYINM